MQPIPANEAQLSGFVNKIKEQADNEDKRVTEVKKSKLRVHVPSPSTVCMRVMISYHVISLSLSPSFMSPV
jgi:hypothetical protein